MPPTQLAEEAGVLPLGRGSSALRARAVHCTARGKVGRPSLQRRTDCATFAQQPVTRHRDPDWQLAGKR